MVAQFTFQSNRGRAGRRRLIIATLLALCVLALDLASGGMIRAQVRALGATVWTAGDAVRAGIFDSGYFSTHRALARENATLRERLASAQENAAAYEALRQENDSLRALTNLSDVGQGITASVVSSVRASPYGTFSIAAGKTDVAVGDLVLTQGGFVVGRVSDIGSRSLVTEVFASGASIDALVGGAQVVVEGHGSGNARASVPRGIPVAVGAPVVAPSLGSRPVGVVGSVESDPARAEQKIYIRLPLNLSSLRFVYVVHAE